MKSAEHRGSGMTWSIGATGTKVSLGRRVTSVWIELAPRGYVVMDSLGYLDTWYYPMRVNFWPLQMPHVLSLVGSCGREIGRTELVEDYFVLILVGRGGSWNYIRIVWINLEIALMADSWHVDQLIFLKFVIDASRILTPWWLRSCGCDGWYYASSIDRRSPNVNRLFGDRKFELETVRLLPLKYK